MKNGFYNATYCVKEAINQLFKVSFKQASSPETSFSSSIAQNRACLVFLRIPHFSSEDNPVRCILLVAVSGLLAFLKNGETTRAIENARIAWF